MGIKINLNSDKQKKIPEEFKDLAKDFAEKGFITTSSDNCCAVFIASSF